MKKVLKTIMIYFLFSKTIHSIITGFPSTPFESKYQTLAISKKTNLYFNTFQENIENVALYKSIFFHEQEEEDNKILQFMYHFLEM